MKFRNVTSFKSQVVKMAHELFDKFVRLPDGWT